MTTSSPCDPPDAPPTRTSRSRRLLSRVAHRRTSRPPSPAAGRLPHRRTLGLGLTLLLAVTVGVTLARAGGSGPGPGTTVRGGAAPGAGAGDHDRRAAYPWTGDGSFATAEGDSLVQGTYGPLRRYRVAVERGAGQDAGDFAAAVDQVLADRRGWIASEELRVQRVADPDDADFTVYLATPDTSERMCAEGGLSTEGYTSCRLPGQVIINLARWMDAVPDYGAPLEIYRAYVINHEVGHELGEQHQACPGPGEPAPVMQQQTYGLDGCVANAWPYVDGSRYVGELIPGI